MKQINIMGGQKILIEDQRAKALMQKVHEGGFIDIDGNMYNVSCIVSIAEPETKPHFMGNPMNKDMTKVCVQGEWRAFCGNRKEIQHKPVVETNQLKLT